MRGILLLSRMSVSAQRRAGPGLVAASLLTLLLSQPFHAPAPIAAGHGAPAVAAAPAGATGGPSDPAVHDADRCPQCRAFAKTRLGLRTPSAGAPVADPQALSLHWPPPAPPSAAGELRTIRPRAPPTA